LASETYDDALRRLLAHEGGYTNHPSDPGGPTNFGITIIDYRKYVKSGATAADVKAMRLNEAKAIYRAKYWNALRCDALPAGVDYAVFDYGVNSGIGRASRVLQRVVGVADDGKVGPKTLAAIGARDPKAIVTAICDERLAFLKRLRTWPVFGKGWGRRVAEVKAAALAAASKAATAPAAAPSSSPGKGVVPVNSAAQKGSAGSVIAAGGASAAQANEPSAVLIIVAATVVIAAAAWLFWRWRQQRQQLAPTQERKKERKL
jgi:lysozyme family protein